MSPLDVKKLLIAAEKDQLGFFQRGRWKNEPGLRQFVSDLDEFYKMIDIEKLKGKDPEATKALVMEAIKEEKARFSLAKSDLKSALAILHQIDVAEANLVKRAVDEYSGKAQWNSW
jgi:hypothetical protein